jgi:hypothetical protein
MTVDLNPFEAGLDFFIKMKKVRSTNCISYDCLIFISAWELY